MKKRKIGAVILSAAMLVASAGTAFAAAEENAYVLLADTQEALNDEVLVDIISPTAGSVVYSGYNMTVEADAEAVGGISRVEFFCNGEKLSEDTTAPYQALIKAPDAEFAVTARAYSLNGGFAEDTVTVGVDKNIGNREVTYLDADFESGLPIKNINVDKKNEIAQIVPCPDDANGENRGGSVFYLKNASGKGAPWLTYLNADNEPLSGEVVMEFKFMSDMPSGWPNDGKQRWMMCYDGQGQVANLLELNGTTLNCFTSPSETRAASLTKDLKYHVWYDMKFTINIDTLTYDVEFDGKTVHSNLPLPHSDTRAERWKNIIKIEDRVTGVTGNGMYVDDWKIYTKPSVREQKVWADVDFESGMPANFGVDKKGETAGVAPRPDNADDHALYIGSKLKANAPFMYYENKGDVISGTVVMEADVIPTDDTFPGAAEIFFLIDANGDSGRLARFEGKDLNLFKGNGGRENIAKITANKPYHLKYTLDTDANTFDVEVTADGVNYSKKNVVYTGAKGALNGLYRIQFRTAGNDSAEELGMYVDNVKIYALMGAAVDGVVFGSDRGVLSVNSEKAPYDMRNITVGFTDPMDEKTLGNITLTDEAGKAVLYSGEYNSKTRQYVMSFSDALSENANYKLNVPASVKGADGVSVESYTLAITTGARRFAVKSAELLNADGEAADKAHTGGSIKADVTVLSNTDDIRSAVAVLALKKDGVLVGCALVTSELVLGEEKKIEVILNDVEEDISGYDIEVLLWKGIYEITPLAMPVIF